MNHRFTSFSRLGQVRPVRPGRWSQTEREDHAVRERYRPLDGHTQGAATDRPRSLTTDTSGMVTDDSATTETIKTR